MKIISIITIFLIAFGCNTVDNHTGKMFYLNGKISGGFKGFLYLEYSDILDSVEVKDGTFSFKGSVKNPSEAYILPHAPNSKLLMTIGGFMIENSEISLYAKYQEKKVNGQWIKFMSIDSVRGSKSESMKKEFEIKMENTFYNAKADSIKGKILYQNLYTFISENPKSVLSGNYLYEYSTFYDLLNVKQINRLYAKLDTSFQNENNIKRLKRYLNQKELLTIGKTPPEIILPDLYENLIDHRSIEAKYLLLDFWASWCIPCRQKNPEMLDTYKTFKNKGFEILGISLDQNKKQWKEAILKDAINWKHVIDSSKTSIERFQINGIPFNLLLDKEGKIVERNINIEELSELLKDNLE